jgi:hypothetical protein
MQGTSEEGPSVSIANHPWSATGQDVADLSKVDAIRCMLVARPRPSSLAEQRERLVRLSAQGPVPPDVLSRLRGGTATGQSGSKRRVTRVNGGRP